MKATNTRASFAALTTICPTLFLTLFLTLISGSFGPSHAQYRNQVSLRGNAIRVEIDYWDIYPGVNYESRIWLYETGAGFNQDSWFICPSGYCVDPPNLLNCRCREDMNDIESPVNYCDPVLVSNISHEMGHKETWECPDPLYKHGNCLGMSGFLNYEGGDILRPIMTGLAIRDLSWCY